MAVGKLGNKTLDFASLLLKQNQVLFLRWYMTSGYAHQGWELLSEAARCSKSVLWYPDAEKICAEHN